MLHIRGTLESCLYYHIGPSHKKVVILVFDQKLALLGQPYILYRLIYVNTSFWDMT